MKNPVNFLFLLLFLFLRSLSGADAFVPQFEKGYVANADGWYAQPLGEHFLPTAATAEALAHKLQAKLEGKEFKLARFTVFVTVDPKAYVGPVLPYVGEVKPATEWTLVFTKGVKLPCGYTPKGEVRIAAWFFASAFLRLPATAEAEACAIVERHEKQMLGIEY